MDDNELIAEFVGLKRHHKEKHLFWIPINDSWNSKEHLQYHREWNWLMPVVRKIATDVIHRDWNNLEEMIENWRPISRCLETQAKDKTASIKDVYKAVVEFIKWYNQQS